MFVEQAESKAIARPVYTVFRSRCSTPGTDGVTVYGLRITIGNNFIEFADIDPCADRVQALADRLAELDVEPCHYADIVQDYIQELAGG